MSTAISYPAPVRTGSRLRTVLTAPVRREPWLATMYVGTGAATGLAAFLCIVVLVFVGVPTLLLALAGLIPLTLAFGISRGVARIERARSAIYLGHAVPLRAPSPGRNVVSRTIRRMRSRAGWLELLYAALVLPILGLLGSFIVFCAWGGAFAWTLFPLYGWAIESSDRFAWQRVGTPSAIVLHLVVGIATLLAAPWLARGVAALSVLVARAMLSPADHELLEHRVETLEDTRARMVDAADAERRRIERDLHDGAQQRIVSVAMALGRAKEKFADDPEAARLLVTEAHAETKQALAELRDLARGIHPAILVDRGLDAALSALAASCPTPVTVSVDVQPRVPKAIEAAAYFIVAESLTNVAKHAHATQAWVTAARHDDVLSVIVSDDGIGGADISAGSGLAGLRDRAHAVDGSFLLVSPPGGLTTVTVELPCGS